MSLRTLLNIHSQVFFSSHLTENYKPGQATAHKQHTVVDTNLLEWITQRKMLVIPLPRQTAAEVPTQRSVTAAFRIRGNSSDPRGVSEWNVGSIKEENGTPHKAKMGMINLNK
ncbi:hypothetical protein E2C01_016919 [Portunus trituberculatus]|uniref:Uncharacterized protein n=1 Tax=Portunus trituberculatus TaxID=210409 RepID=A0A5B7DQC5_PORTR|nr:hypothetical protein [Portunus trituberculatus]